MTKEEAAKILKLERDSWRENPKLKVDQRLYDAVDAAIKALEQESKSEWEHDHEILKAYSDGANEVLDKIRADIEQAYCKVANDYDHGRNYGLYMAMQIIEKYKAESEDKE